MILTYKKYKALGGELEQPIFKRLGLFAQALIESRTIGIDGVNKLKEFFPEDEDDQERIYGCVMALIELKQEMDQYRKQSTITTETNGIKAGGAVTSISSGSESISFASGAESSSSAKAVMDLAYQDQLIGQVIDHYLSGVKDRNGIHLLYLGPYEARWKA